MLSRFAIFSGLLLATVAFAGEPTIRNLNVRGLKIGGMTTITVDGDELGLAPKLLLPFPVKQNIKGKSTDKQAIFEVILDDKITPGLYPCAVTSEGGVSSSVVLMVDRLTHVPLIANVEQLPVVLHGTLTGGTVSEVSFTGKANQKILIEVEAQRMGSKLRPVLHLYNAKRRQLGWSWPVTSLFGDTRLEATLPEDGKYTISLHDVEYAGPSPGFFLLKIGQWDFVDQVFPPVASKGQSLSFEMSGIASLKSPPMTMSGAKFQPLEWPREGNWSGRRPFVKISSHAEVLETPGKEPQTLPALPVGVSGKLLTEFEEDRYRLPVTPGSKLRLEVFAERLGSPLDVALVLRDEMNKDLVRGEDSPGTLDPVLDFVVPEKMTTLIVAVMDAQGRGSPRGIYRLVIDSSTAKQEPVIFTTEQNLSLPVNGKIVLPILIDRKGYPKSIEIASPSLPGGMKLEGTTIPDGADGTLLTISRGEGNGEAIFSRLLAKKSDGEMDSISIKNHPLEKSQPWLADQLLVGFSTYKASDFQIDWNNLPPDAGIVLAGKLNLPVKLTRVDAKSPIRLTLMTSQLAPLVNNLPDLNQTLRLEKPIELAASVNEGTPTMLIPSLLASPVYDVTVQAELLGADKKTVLARAFAPVRRMIVRSPIFVNLEGPTKLETTLDAKTGSTVKLVGKVDRKEGFAGEVTVTLIGIPTGAKADPVTVKAGSNDFTMNLILPLNTVPGEIKTLKLSASIVPDPKLPAIRVKSRDVDLVLVVKPTAK